MRPIHLLSFLAKRAPAKLPLPLRGRSAFHPRRATFCMASSATADGVNDEGRIWIHRPFEITPSPSAAAGSAEPLVASCLLPSLTPRPPPEERLHSMLSSSPSPRECLERIHRAKAQLYESQFESRVPKEARTRIERRTLRSPRGLGEVDVTVYFPEGDGARRIGAPLELRGICLHVHGGGWLWGDSCYQVAHRCLEMAESMNAAVVSVEYSLFCWENERGNEIDDSFDPVRDVSIAMDWIESEGAGELNARPLFVASGESSGAHLLLLAMLLRRDREGLALHPLVPLPPTKRSPTTRSPPWKCLSLIYGVYDLSGTPSLRADGESSSPLCGDDLLRLCDMYYRKVGASARLANDDISGKTELDRQHPSLSPLYANLSHLPPALVTVGTADPLLDDSLFLACNYSAYGNHVELVIYEGGEHGIGHFGTQEDEEMGVRARGHTLEFMGDHLDD